MTLHGDIGICGMGAVGLGQGGMARIPPQAMPFLQAGQVPPQPGSPAAVQLSFDLQAEAQAYADWWYANYMADAP